MGQDAAWIVVRAGTLALGVLLAGVGCGPPLVPAPFAFGPPAAGSPPAADPGASILLLETAGDGPHLLRVGRGRSIELGLPDRATRWVSGDSRRGLVATVGAAGRLFVAGPIAPGGQPTWRSLSVQPPSGGAIQGPFSFGTLSPDGSRVAVLESDFSGASPSELVIAEIATGRATVLPLPGAPDGPPLAWVGPDRLAALVRDASDVVGVEVIDLATGHVERIGPGVQALAFSATGAIVALQVRDDPVLRAGPADAWLAGGGAPPGSVGKAIGGVAGQVVLDATGRRLAVVWLAPSGEDTRVGLYEGIDDRWSAVRVDPVADGVSRVLIVGFEP